MSHALVYAVLCLAPFTEFEFAGLLAPADIALGLAAGCWVLALGLDWKNNAPMLKGLARYWPMFLFAGWMAVSACFASSHEQVLVKMFQTVEYFVVAVVLAHDFFTGVQEFRSPEVQKRRMASAGGLMLGVFAVCVLMAAWQYFSGPWDNEGFGVRGFFKHRNVLGGYAALLAPVCFGVMCETRNTGLKVALGIMVTLTLLVTLSGAAYAAMLLAIAGLAAVRGKWWFLATSVAIVLFHAVVLDAGANKNWLRENVSTHLQSVAVYESDGQPAPRYPEWQAALLLMTDYPVAGVGPGKNYRHKIGQYYGVVPRSARDKDESDIEIQNQWLLLGATLGTPGLLAFLAMLVSGAAAGARAARRLGRGDWRRGLAGGMAAGLLAFGVVLVWHSLLIRGTGLVFAIMLAACHALDVENKEAGA